MSRIRKRFERLLNNPVGVKWDELTTIMEYFGCIVTPPSSGSHWIVSYPGLVKRISVPVHNNTVKSVYVKALMKLVQEIDLRDELEEES